MIGITHTGVYFPPRIETAKEIAQRAEIPENVIVEKFGLVQKHVSDSSIHASDMAIQAAKPILEKVDPLSIDVLIYFGSSYKDYMVWTCGTKIVHELGLKNAYAFEIMNVSSCFPIALKVARDMLVADDSIRNILLVGGCKEAELVDYQNVRSRFMFNFADGGAAALVSRDSSRSRVLGSCIYTDGSFHDDVRVVGGGSKHPASLESVQQRLHFLDVKDPKDMKQRLDPVSVSNFVHVVQEAMAKSGSSVSEIDWLIPLHTKRSMFRELLDRLELREEQAIYLDHYGHLSALDPCIGLHLGQERQLFQKGDKIVTVSAGTGYTWAATVLEWLE
ncbi:3-oxoacyl-ACP synthase [Brevibacillus panacihumi W25]|uniref:3-oxoacyl-ACP synthase n=1 Tax=Brevibacillus panacihumi W25 TaxID=1408254 RepID=V6M297_9BACL|nr:3-oxoacyl-ACP synthase [Brevibacillus panacihumi]EST52756.1 3-oxoacyl-ACP synthase [Brevibacillus panacihumi W25]